MYPKITPILEQSDTPLDLQAVIDWITHLQECISKPVEITRDFIEAAIKSSSKVEAWFKNQFQGIEYSWLDGKFKSECYSDFAELKLVLSKAIEHYAAK